MEQKIVITERNRDGAKIWLEHEYDDFYSIHTDKDYVLQYVGCSFEELPDDAQDYDDEFELSNGKKTKVINLTYDPSGGPYMSVGDLIDNKYKILRFFFNKELKKTLFKLKEEN